MQQPRLRRARCGELIQIDGSDHEWFEQRGPRCVLLVFVDDATGKLMELRFCHSESTFEYWTSGRRYLQRHGRQRGASEHTARSAIPMSVER